MRYAPAVIALVVGLLPQASAAQSAWDEIKAALYGEQALLGGQNIIAIDAPYRSENDAQTPIAVQIDAPDGFAIRKAYVIIDNNPMPVSAVFTMTTPRPSFFFDANFRINGPTPLHIVAEADDGRLWVSETFVKTSGLGACSAPPGTDPELALANLGQMSLELEHTRDPIAALRGDMQLDVSISHPSHSGMQMDQVSLLFIPMRYVETVEIDLDGQPYATMTGSISISENPRISLGVPAQTQSAQVKMTDTDGTVAQIEQRFAGY